MVKHQYLQYICSHKSEKNKDHVPNKFNEINLNCWGSITKTQFTKQFYSDNTNDIRS